MNEQARTHSNGFKLYKYRSKNETDGNGLTNRILDKWNRLGSQVVSMNTVESFKRRSGKFVDEDERLF